MEEGKKDVREKEGEEGKERDGGGGGGGLSSLQCLNDKIGGRNLEMEAFRFLLVPASGGVGGVGGGGGFWCQQCNVIFGKMGFVSRSGITGKAAET